MSGKESGPPPDIDKNISDEAGPGRYYHVNCSTEPDYLPLEQILGALDEKVWLRKIELLLREGAYQEIGRLTNLATLMESFSHLPPKTRREVLPILVYLLVAFLITGCGSMAEQRATATITPWKPDFPPTPTPRPGPVPEPIEDIKFDQTGPDDKAKRILWGNFPESWYKISDEKKLFDELEKVLKVILPSFLRALNPNISGQKINDILSKIVFAKTSTEVQQFLTRTYGSRSPYKPEEISGLTDYQPPEGNFRILVAFPSIKSEAERIARRHATNNDEIAKYQRFLFLFNAADTLFHEITHVIKSIYQYCGNRQLTRGEATFLQTLQELPPEILELAKDDKPTGIIYRAGAILRVRTAKGTTIDLFTEFDEICRALWQAYGTNKILNPEEKIGAGIYSAREYYPFDTLRVLMALGLHNSLGMDGEEFFQRVPMIDLLAMTEFYLEKARALRPGITQRDILLALRTIEVKNRIYFSQMPDGQPPEDDYQFALRVIEELAKLFRR